MMWHLSAVLSNEPAQPENDSRLRNHGNETEIIYFMNWDFKVAHSFEEVLRVWLGSILSESIMP